MARIGEARAGAARDRSAALVEGRGAALARLRAALAAVAALAIAETITGANG